MANSALHMMMSYIKESPVASPARMSIACQRCRRRKTKCDRLYPKCSTCRRLGVECVSSQQFSPDASEGHPRGYIEKLEQEVRALELEASRIASSQGDNATIPPQTASSTGCLSLSNASLHENQSPGENASVISSRSVPQWSLLSERPPGTNGHHRISLFEGMLRCSLVADNSDPRHSSPLISRINLTLPTANFNMLSQLLESDADTYKTYLEQYFQHFHPVLPYLDEFQVRICFRSVQTGQSSDKSLELILCMVLSIGACCPNGFRMSLRGLSNSRQLFMYALESMDHCVRKEDVFTAQAVLLFTFYSLIHSDSGSSWHLKGLAVRICLTLGFHQESSYQGHDSSGDEGSQQLRLIFWSTYALDRWISLALGRPFGIQTSDITTKLPKDEYLANESPSRLFHWAVKISEIKQTSKMISPQDIDDILQVVACTGSWSPVFGMLMLQTISWIVCPPHLPMDIRGMELAVKLSSVHISLLSDFLSSNGPVFWIWGYGIFHSAVLQIFIRNLVRTTRPDQGVLTTDTSGQEAIRILQSISGEFSGLRKYSELLKVLATKGGIRGSNMDIDFLVGTHTYNICKATLALCSMSN